MSGYFWVALGGAIGSLGRWSVAQYISHHIFQAIPLAILLVNVIGSFIIGTVWVWLNQRTAGGSEALQQFLMVGVLGGFTTFSSFSNDTIQLIMNGHWLMAAANIILNVGACLLAVALGIYLAKSVFI